MKQPEYLQKGDAIAIVSPAGAIDKSIVTKAVKRIEQLGYRTLIYPHVTGKVNYFAGTDEERLSDLQAALDNPNIKAILSSRGGYGVGRIIDKVDFTLFNKHPKWFIGFSDITVLHGALQQQGFCSIHGNMCRDFALSEGYPNSDTVIQILEGNMPVYSLQPLKNEQDTNGLLVGGNLALICSTVGTAFEPLFANNILVIEDIGEELYKIDRMLRTLKMSGKLSELTGLLVGEFTDTGDSEFGETLQEIVLEAVAPYNYPVFFNLPVGHGKVNFPLVLGREVVISKKVSDWQLAY